jgi:putative sporulation protein YtaF
MRSSLKVKPLGIVIKVFYDPVMADLDESGDIDLKEALTLGVALGLDAFSAGLGVSIAGFSMALLPYVMLGSMFFVYLGQSFGKMKMPDALGQRWSLIPGLILMRMEAPLGLFHKTPEL